MWEPYNTIVLSTKILWGLISGLIFDFTRSTDWIKLAWNLTSLLCEYDIFQIKWTIKLQNNVFCQIVLCSISFKEWRGYLYSSIKCPVDGSCFHWLVHKNPNGNPYQFIIHMISSMWYLILNLIDLVINFPNSVVLYFMEKSRPKLC